MLVAFKNCGLGSPPECTVSLVKADGYSAGEVVRITNGLMVKRTTDPHSCPAGFKIWSPRNQKDWTIIFNAMGNRRDKFPERPYNKTRPNLLIDVTRRKDGCGGCKGYAMNSDVPEQGSWSTTDGSAWWLRDTKYKEPNGDYYANCYLEFTKVNPADVRFNDRGCSPGSRDYLCQPIDTSKRGYCFRSLRPSSLLHSLESTHHPTLTFYREHTSSHSRIGILQP